MRENVVVEPSGEVERRRTGTKAKHAAARSARPSRASMSVEALAQAVKVKHIARRVSLLRAAQLRRRQSELCCSFDSDTPSSSDVRSFRPWRSV